MPTTLPTRPSTPHSDIERTVRPIAWAMASFYVLVTLILRFAPLPENFATFGALALFSGLFLRGGARWAVPLVALFLADCIGHFSGNPGMGFYYVPSMVFNYLGLAAVVGIGLGLARLWGQRGNSSARSWMTLASGAIGGSLAFFLLSNFGAWLDPRMGYERTLEGLGRCYAMGLPFWRATLMSDLFFGVGFVALAWGMATILATRTRVRNT